VTAFDLADLPAPPEGREGWPWTWAPPPCPARRADGSPWPTLAVVTPSYQQGEYLEETIRSVLLQGYPALEYAVIDGASTDGTGAVLEKYRAFLTACVAEPDRGQVDALQKGLARTTGDVFNWINSDDWLAPLALRRVAEAFVDVDAVAGTCVNVEPDGRQRRVRPAGLAACAMVRAEPTSVFQQPSMWLSRRGIEEAGGFDPELHCAFDWDLVVRYLARRPRVRYLDEELAFFRLHPASKTSRQLDRFAQETRLAVRAIERSTPDAALRRACGFRLRREAWWDEISTALSQRDGAPVRRALGLALATLRDPTVRVSRPTLGALRRLLAGAA